MPDAMSDLITDAVVEAAAQAFASHEYRVNRPEMVPFCSCGWTASEPYGVAEYDQHVARLTLEAVAPLIAAKAWEEGYQACRNRPRVDGYLINRANPYQTRADEIARAES